MAEKLSSSERWIRSLHYRENLISVEQRTELSGFYLSPEADPHAELLANLKAAREQETYQCSFPYRAKLLARAGLWTPRAIVCDGPSSWKGFFSKDKLSLAFASQYLSNPASVFGHTFLIFSPDREESNPYPRNLDITIGYAADMPPETGPLAYIVKGLGGGFRGRFYTEPFYKRIREYTNMEQRDLWIYPLKMTPEQIDDLLDHIYELSQRDYFKYYFLDENCSYMLLRVLNVIFPDGNLLNDYWPYTLPVETIKRLDSEGHLSQGFLEPSLRRKFLNDLSFLSASEASEVRKAVRGDFAALHSKDAMDVMITYLDKNKIEKKGVISPQEQAHYQELLIRRSKLGPKTVNPLRNPSLDPLEGHFPLALTVNSGVIGRESYQELELRPAVHELLDRSHGYIPSSQIKLLSPALRLGSDGGVRLQRLEFAKAANIVPYRAIDPIYSWKFIAERNRLQDKLCFDCSANRVAVAVGLSYSLASSVDVFLLPGYQMEEGSDLPQSFRSGLGFVSGMIVNFSEKMKLSPGLDYFHADRWGRFQQTITKASIELSYNPNRSFSLRGAYREWRTFPVRVPTRDLSGSVAFFF